MITSKVCIIDYGACNLASLQKAVSELSSNVRVLAAPPSTLQEYTHYFLPGVGSFPFGVARLKELGWFDFLKAFGNQKTNLLGICLGMQLLADEGEEDGGAAGLGLISGKVIKLKVSEHETLPHVGWNNVTWKEKFALAEGMINHSDFYFVHSYHFVPQNQQHILATTDYGKDFVSVVGNDQNIFGVQFHPEKSSRCGRQLLKNFLKL